MQGLSSWWHSAITWIPHVDIGFSHLLIGWVSWIPVLAVSFALICVHFTHLFSLVHTGPYSITPSCIFCTQSQASALVHTWSRPFNAFMFIFTFVRVVICMHSFSLAPIPTCSCWFLLIHINSYSFMFVPAHSHSKSFRPGSALILLVSALVRKLHPFLPNAYSHSAKRHAQFGVLTFLHQYLKRYKFLSSLTSKIVWISPQIWLLRGWIIIFQDLYLRKP